MTSKERDREDETARQGVSTVSEDEESLKDRVGRRWRLSPAAPLLSRGQIVLPKGGKGERQENNRWQTEQEKISEEHTVFLM